MSSDSENQYQGQIAMPKQNHTSHTFSFLICHFVHTHTLTHQPEIKSKEINQLTLGIVDFTAIL